MRTLRLSLVGTVILALLGGPGGAVVAQDTEDPGAPEPGTASETTWEPADSGARIGYSGQIQELPRWVEPAPGYPPWQAR